MDCISQPSVDMRGRGKVGMVWGWLDGKGVDGGPGWAAVATSGPWDNALWCGWSVRSIAVWNDVEDERSEAIGDT